MVPASHFNPASDVRRHGLLLELTDLLVREAELGRMLRELAQRLHEVVSYELISFALHDPTRNRMRVYRKRGEQLAHQLDLPTNETLCAWAWEEQRPLVLADVQTARSRYPEAVERLQQENIRSYCSLPLTTPERRLGSLCFGSPQADAYSERDVGFLSRVAAVVTLGLENVLMREAFRHQKDRLEALLQVSTELLSNLDVQELLPAISEFVRKVLPQDFAVVTLYDPDMRSLRVHALDSPLARGLVDPGTAFPLSDSLSGWVFLHGEAKLYNREDIAWHTSPFNQRLLEARVQSLCILPLISRRGAFGTLDVGSKEDKGLLAQDLNFLKQVAAQVSLAWENAQAYAKISELTERLEKEKLCLQDEIRLVHNFEEMVGESSVLKRVLAQVDTVAPSDATVLILGETGTGKELVARAIHRMSSRKDASFVKLNCAAIPTGLLESELFGHEKGAFTGAVSQKIGRLELADHGTLFLDEVGEIALELQPKLLRVLQDQEFERLGGTRTIKVNVRLISATNRDLAESVSRGEFRSDLYYRLHVFPVRMPSLRERTQDIPLLVRYFVGKSAQRLNKQIETIPAEAMRALGSWRWPGNVRELENFIERCVILSDGSTLNVPLAELRLVPDVNQRSSVLESREREYILRVLRETGGVIAGVHGAAARLGMKRTTLQSRIQKLGISRNEYQN